MHIFLPEKFSKRTESPAKLNQTLFLSIFFFFWWRGRWILKLPGGQDSLPILARTCELAITQNIHILVITRPWGREREKNHRAQNRHSLSRLNGRQTHWIWCKLVLIKTVLVWEGIKKTNATELNSSLFHISFFCNANIGLELHWGHWAEPMASVALFLALVPLQNFLKISW